MSVEDLDKEMQELDICLGKIEQTPKDKINQKLYEKVVNEYNQCVENVKKLPVNEIIQKSYEMVCKGDMTYLFDRNRFSVKEAKALLKTPNLLQQCYDEWIKSDGNINEMMEYSVDKATNMCIDDYLKSKKKKESIQR